LETAVGTDLATKDRVTKDNVAKFLDDISNKQNKFTTSYFESISGLVSAELKAFQASFDKYVPWYAKPLYLLYVSVALLVLYLAYLIIAGFKGRREGSAQDGFSVE
jgi:hypothetical protein